MKIKLRSRVVSYLSACYAVILVILGVIFSLFEVGTITVGTYSYKISFYKLRSLNIFIRSYFHLSSLLICTLQIQLIFIIVGFYIYLYGLGIFFLVYVYATVIKVKHQTHAERKQSAANNITAPGMTNVRSCHSLHGDIIPMVGSLFLRIAAILFCVGSIIDNGLKFGMNLTETCGIAHVLNIIHPMAQALFMFFEIYFIFNNTKMCIRQYPIVAKFGIMHLIASNVCIWVMCTIMEIHSPIKKYETRQLVNDYNPNNMTDYVNSVAGNSLISLTSPETDDAPNNCTRSTIMINMANKAKPYTYPCTVQFSILVISILYVMWRHIDTDSDTQCSDCKEHTKRSHLSTTRTIDCSSTSRGLLLGLLTVVGVISCLIAFFMLTTNDFHNMKASLIINNYKIAMYLIMTVISVAVLLKLRALDYNNCRSTMMEDVLLGVCVLAVFGNDLVGIISGIMTVNRLEGLLLLATSLADLIECIIQTSAIVMGLKLCIPDVEEKQRLVSKPGRECVTYLAVANISLWILSLFNDVVGQGFKIQHAFLGSYLWSIFMNVVYPILTFYHLFAASCFIDIWYNAYRLPSSLSSTDV